MCTYHLYIFYSTITFVYLYIISVAYYLLNLACDTTPACSNIRSWDKDIGVGVLRMQYSVFIDDSCIDPKAG